MIYFLFILISLIYAGFILWLTDGIRNLSSPTENEYIYPETTVIVSARNEENNISNLVNALVNQSYPKELLQLIIINDRSTDQTAEILTNYEREIDNLTIVTIQETPAGWAPKKWALNTAINTVTTEIILQTDADCIPHNDWVKCMVQPFSSSEVGFVSGPAPLTNKSTLIDSLYELDSLAQDAFSAGGFSQGMVFSCTGRNIGYSKQAFDDVSGYENVSHFISGDDDLLLHKITGHPSYKAQFVLSKESVVESPPPSSLEQFIHQRLRFASKGFSYYNIKTSASLRVVLPFLYVTNLVALLSLFNFTETSHFYWMWPWIIKTMVDGIITYVFYHSIGRKWSLGTMTLLSLIHPLYIVTFGILGPFSTFEWKLDD
ncbi:MAG: glycosyltransferase [Candidatus Marinimicrobia bacterium]|jgi:cellulose synthase/poly-beta-1,6-N-acetylglucosamine synthase-like glycosyltransferase|nr:glycosyltransferase [Candidatus Neomarinimicrobiota bacterium]MBT5955665.1 glycosyltransferase [Candidatus Neomarinimicrobiota bacterium]MBT7377048.1 glycosyltransferase [Candidatus Neomarinimicrobiota bacterium]